MSRHETDREDLMQEATGLARRVEWQVPFIDEPVVAGFKKNGACSVYFGAEPMLQFAAKAKKAVMNSRTPKIARLRAGGQGSRAG